jgi:aspartate kinase
MVVMKFGGSSVESAEAIRRVISIVRSQEDRRPVVVVSAMGKTTNKLLALADAAVANDPEYPHALAELRRYHWDIGIELVPSDKLEALANIVETHFRELEQVLHGLAILRELTPRSIDAISSYGERLSSQILCMALQSEGISSVQVDAREMIISNDQHTCAVPDYAETYQRLKKHVARLTEKHVVVMGGFIAGTPEGITTTLGRGGSDFSAAIIGAGIGAEEIQIWTDVDGMMTTDPRLVSHAVALKTLSFPEAAELAYFGAKVLHPATVHPAIEMEIPVVILNSRRPDGTGTRLIAAPRPSKNVIKAIAFKRNITLVNIHSARMLMAVGFLSKVFDVFQRWGTPVDVVTTSEVNVSMTIDDPKAISQIRSDLEQFADVTIEGNLAIVSTVGEGLCDKAGIAARIFKALEHINVRMISQGASLLNVTLVIADTDLEAAVNALHDEFFAELDPEVFG